MDLTTFFASANGDPVKLVILIAQFLLACLAAWLIIAVVFLPFYSGLKWLIDTVIESIASAAKWLFARAGAIAAKIGESFGSLADAGKMKVLLVDQIASLKATARNATAKVERQLKRYRSESLKASQAEGGVPGLITRIDAELERLRAAPRIDPESLKIEVDRGINLFRAIFLTLFAVSVMAINTALLNEFFRGLIPYTIPYLYIPLALVIALVYTFVEFVFGLVLEIENERRRGQSVGFFQIVLVMLILVVVLVEVGLYTLLSFEIAWPWPEGMTVPQWLNGWLGLMGLIIGGGVTVAGYAMGDAWAKVMRANAVFNMKKQARLLDGVLSALTNRINQVDTVLSAAKGRIGAGSDPASLAAGEDIRKKIETEIDHLGKKLGAIEYKTFRDVDDAGPGEAIRRQAFAIGIALAAVCFLTGNTLLHIRFWNSTPIGEIAAWAAPALAAVLALGMAGAGRLAATQFVLTTAFASANEPGEQRLTHHGLGPTQWVAVAAAIAIAAFGIWAATNGFARLSVGLIMASLALNGLCFIIGAFLEEIVRALGVGLLALGRSGLALIFMIGGLVVGLVWVLMHVLHILIGVIAAPALWLWRQFVPLFSRGAKGAARA